MYNYTMYKLLRTASIPTISFALKHPCGVTENIFTSAHINTQMHADIIYIYVYVYIFMYICICHSVPSANVFLAVK